MATLINLTGGVTDTTTSNVTFVGKTNTQSNLTTRGDNVIVDAANRADVIINYGSKVSISGGAGGDKIYVEDGSDVTVKGGTGADKIYNNTGNGVIYQYATGDGKDSIYGFNSNDTLKITAGKITANRQVGADYCFTIGSGTTNQVILKNVQAGSTIHWQDSLGADFSFEVPKIIYGTTAGDILENSQAQFTIDAKAGNDTITNNGDEVSISAGANADKITNTGAQVIVDAGTGNDTVYNTGDEVSIFGGTDTGKDSILSSGKNVSIDAGAGDDTIKIFGDLVYEVTVEGGKGSDKIYNESVALEGKTGVIYKFTDGDGSDIIYGFNPTFDILQFNTDEEISYEQSCQDLIFTAGDVTVTIKDMFANAAIKYKKGDDGEIQTATVSDEINGTDSADNIYNTVNEVNIAANGGDDYIYNSGEGLEIDAGAGKDTVLNKGNSVVINGGDGKDSIVNGDLYSPLAASFAEIYGGADSDTIINYATIVTIEGGTGNDIIYNYGDAVTYKYTEGDGNDTIYGFTENDVLEIDGEISDTNITSAGIVITVKGATSATNGIITIKDVEAGTKINLIDSSGERELPVYSVIEMDSRSPSYENYDDEVKINGSSASDAIVNYGDSVKIDGSAQSDTIENYGVKVTIDGGAGDDLLYNSRDEGLYISEDEWQYAEDNPVYISGGAGKDTVENWQRNATISGGDGDDSISNYAAQASLSAGAGNDTIETWGGVVSGDKGNDLIILGTGTEERKESVLVIYKNGDGSDTIQNFGSADALQIFDSESILQSDGTLAKAFDTSRVTRKGKDVYIQFTDTTATRATAQTIVLKDFGKNQLQIYSNPNNEGDTSYAAVELYSDVVATTDVTITATRSSDFIQNDDWDFDDGYYINALDGDDTISNRGSFVTVNGGVGTDSILNAYEGDLTWSYYNIEMEMETVTNSAGNSIHQVKRDSDGNIIYQTDADGNYVYSFYGNADREEYLSWLTQSHSGQASTILGGAGSDVIKNYASGIAQGKNYIQLVDNPWTLESGESAYETISAEEDAYVVISGEVGDDNIYNTGSLVSISGGAGADTIINDAVDISDSNVVTINAGAGNDLIINQLHEAAQEAMAFDSKLVAKNKVIYEFGTADNNSTIRGFTERDVIHINNTAGLTSASASTGLVEGAAILTIGRSNVLIEDFVGKEINYEYVNSDGELVEDSTIVSNYKILSAQNDAYYYNGSYMMIDGGAGNDSIDVTEAYNVTVNGGSGRDYIRVGGDEEKDLAYDGDSDDVLISVNGGAGNDSLYINYVKNIVVDGGIGHDFINLNDMENATISAGRGNDTIYAWSSKPESSFFAGVTYQYTSGDGRDLIFGYEDDQQIQIISGTVSKVMTKNDDTVIKIGGGSITLKDYTADVNLIDANGDAIEYESEDLLDDDLFMKFEARLADIAEIPAENYSAGKFEPTDYTSLAQENNYLAYNSEKDK